MAGAQDMTLRVKIKTQNDAPANLAATGMAAKGAAGGIAAMGAAAAAAAIPLAAITVGVAAIAVAAKFLKAAISLAIEFEDIMVRTAAVTGQSAEKMADLEGEVRRLGSATRFTATEVAKAAQVLAIAGITVDEMISDKALEQVLKLAEVGGVDVPTAAGIAVAAVKGFRLELEELGRVNDVLAYTMTRTNVTLETLGEAMKYLAPTSAAVGVSIEEAAAAVGILGNAGIRGTVAGTQLRNALNKMITPSEDSRKVIESLGLDIYKLTPAGDAAQNTLRMVVADLDRTKRATNAASLELKALTREMAGMSLDQQRNNLTMMQIRRRAERQGRSLTQSEMDQIARLESANADLDISMAEGSITRQEMQMRSEDLKDSQSLLTEQFKSLNNEVNMQIQGITSLNDVVQQLMASGASTAQIMEIFGVRGGGAILALTGQHEGFKTLTSDLQEAGGTADRMAKQITSSTAGQLATMQSAFDEMLLTFGQEFLPVLRDDLIPLIRDDLIPLLEAFVPIAQIMASALKPFATVLSAIAKSTTAIDNSMGWAKGTSLLNMISPGSFGNAFTGLGTALSFFADGGIVTGPTMGVVGEAGPEVIIPLDRLESVLQPYGNLGNESSAMQTSTKTTEELIVNIQNITVNGVMNADDVGNVIVQALPSALSRALGKNTRGTT